MERHLDVFDWPCHSHMHKWVMPHPPTLGGVRGVGTKRVDVDDRELRKQGNGPGKD